MAIREVPVGAHADARFEELVLDFLAYLELERGMSRNTLQSYRSDLLQFGVFLAERGVEAVEARGRDISDFLTALGTGAGGARAATATIQRKAAALRSFYRHLRRDGLLDSDPTAAVTTPRSAQRLPNVLGHAEVRRLLEQPQGSEAVALRDRALLELLYACGLRATEVIELDASQIDLEDGLVRVRGKGSKERIVPVGTAAVRAVGLYLRSARPRLVGGQLVPRLFVNFRGGALTRQGLYKIVQRHARGAGLGGRMSPHTLRHTFATHLLAGGRDGRQLMVARGCAPK